MSHNFRRTGEMLITSTMTNETSAMKRAASIDQKVKMEKGDQIYHPKKTTDSKGKVLKVTGASKLPQLFEECKLKKSKVVDVVQNNLFQQEDYTFGQGRVKTMSTA